MSTEVNPTLGNLPPAQSRRLIEFDEADVISPRICPSRNVVVVTGRKPLGQHDRQPATTQLPHAARVLGHRVVGAVPMIGQPAIMSYAVELEPPA
jgi:hypothetical protein